MVKSRATAARWDLKAKTIEASRIIIFVRVFQNPEVFAVKGTIARVEADWLKLGFVLNVNESSVDQPDRRVRSVFQLIVECIR